MPLSQCPDELIAFASRLADASGAVIRQYFRASFVVEEKSDLSPVTIADRKAEETLRELINQERPQDGIIGEEFGIKWGESDYEWILDPIDGTRAFACGKPMFGTMIALLHEDKPILGVIDQPVSGERWIGAAGHDTTFNGERCLTRPCSQLRDGIVNLGPQAFPFGNAVSLDAYRRVAKKAKTTSVGGDCYTYGLIASGHIDLCIEHGLKLYDYAAIIPIIEGAGGCVTDWNGKPLTREAASGQVVASGDRRLHNEAIELIEGAL